MRSPKKPSDSKKAGSVRIVRNKSGRFEKGYCPNPLGRKPGNPNKTTLAAQAMFNGQADEICQAILELAIEEKYWPALKTALERILPRLKSPPLAFQMPPLENLDDLVNGHKEVIDALSRGDITAEDARVFESLLDGTRRALASANLAERVATLEFLAGEIK